MAHERFPLEKIFNEQSDPLQPFAVADSSGETVYTNTAFELLTKFTGGNSLQHFFDFIERRDFYKAYIESPHFTEQPLIPQKDSYILTLYPCNEMHFFQLQPPVKRQNTEILLRRLLHDVRTPLSTALMAINNLDFILQEETGKLNDEEYAPKEFTGSTAKALHEINEKLDIISILVKHKVMPHKRIDLISLLDSLPLPSEFSVPPLKKTNDKEIMVQCQPAAVTNALRLITQLPGHLQLAEKNIFLRLSPGLNDTHFCLEITNIAETAKAANILQPLVYNKLPDNLQIKIAIAEHILFKNNMILTGTVDPAIHIFNLIILIHSEE